MGSHQERYLLIVIAFCVTALTLCVGMAFGMPETVSGALVGALAILGPALIDAKAVEARRVDPFQKPIEDDQTVLEIPRGD